MWWALTKVANLVARLVDNLVPQLVEKRERKLAVYLAWWKGSYLVHWWVASLVFQMVVR